MAIVTYGGTDNVTISNNNLFIHSTNGGYVYGIDSSVYGSDYSSYSASPTNHNVINNTVAIMGTVSMAEGIYYDELVNANISNNIVAIMANDGDLYGVALSYSYANANPENVTIDNNKIAIVGTNMVYGVELSDVKSINVTNNDIYAISEGGAFAVAAQGNDLLIDSNSLNTYSASTDGITSWDSFGVGNQSAHV